MISYNQPSLLASILVLGLCITACESNQDKKHLRPQELEQEEQEEYASKKRKIEVDSIEPPPSIIRTDVTKNGITFHLNNDDALFIPQSIYRHGKYAPATRNFSKRKRISKIYQRRCFK